MTSYVITMINITDQDKYKKYADLAGVANQIHGGKFLVRGGNPEVLEGKVPFSRIVVNQFDTRDQAKGFYNSIEYQRARDERIGAADFNMVVVDG